MIGRTSTPRLQFVRSTRLPGGPGIGLVWLGAAEVGQALPPLFVWWRDFAALYVESPFVCTRPAWTRRGPEGRRMFRRQLLRNSHLWC